MNYQQEENEEKKQIQQSENQVDQNRPQTQTNQRPKTIGYQQEFSLKQFTQNVGNFRPISQQFQQGDNIYQKLGFSNITNSSNGFQENQTQKLINKMKNMQQFSSSKQSIPKIMFKDKESLYEETIQLKNLNNFLKNENQQLKSRLINLNRENIKFERMFANVDSNMKPHYNQEASTTKQQQTNQLVLTLKRQLQDTKQQLQQKEIELKNVKRLTKVTNAQEEQAEKKELNEELVRLKAMLEQNLKIEQSADDQSGEQFQFNTLKSDNIEMAAIIKGMEDELNQLSKENQVIKLESHKSKQEKIFIQRELKKKEKMLEAALQNQQENQQTKQSHGKSGISQEQLQQFQMMQVELEKKTNDINHISSTLVQKDKQIFQLEAKLRDTKAELQEASEKAQQKISQLERQLLQLQKKQGNLEQNQSLKEEDEGEEEDQNIQQQIVVQEQENQQQQININYEGYYQVDVIKNFRVNLPELEMSIRQVKFNLKLNRIALSEIDRYLFTEENIQEGNATLHQMEKALKQEPFSLYNMHQILLFARYLVESEDEDQPYFDREKKQSTQIIRTIFKKMMEDYNLQSNQEINELALSLIRSIDRYFQPLYNAMLDIANNQKSDSHLLEKGWITINDIESALQACNIIISKNVKDVMQILLYQKSKDINKCKIDEFFEIFQIENFEQMMQQKSQNQSLSQQLSHNESLNKSLSQNKIENLQYNQNESFKQSFSQHEISQNLNQSIKYQEQNEKSQEILSGRELEKESFQLEQFENENMESYD